MHLSVSRSALALLAAVALAGCGNSGDSQPTPENVSVTAGDGRVVMSWTNVPNVEYWVFGAADPTVTPDNWTGLPESFALIRGSSPQPLCALTNGTEYWMTVNARTGTAGGGPGSAAVGATPRPAGDTWTTGIALGNEINGFGFATISMCRTVNANSDLLRPAKGYFVAVGNGARLFTSLDGVNWTPQVTPTADGFTSDLYAVSVYTATPDTANLNQVWVAVGADSGAIRSVDGVNWTVGFAPVAGSGTLRAITHAGSQFVAVGDGGRIRWSTDGIKWFDRDSPTTQVLRSVVYDDGRYIALGDGGTMMISSDSTTWGVVATGTTVTLRGAAFGNNNANPGNNGVEKINTWVAVGDGGTVLTSTDHGSHWTPQVLPGAPDLVGVGYTTQFIALDSGGGVWRSLDGVSWSGPVASGIGTVKAMDGQSQFGIVAASPGGTVASTF